MDLHRSVHTPSRAVNRNQRLWLLLAFVAAFVVICLASSAQECAQCATSALPQVIEEWKAFGQLSGAPFSGW
jgi:hypothetical protein